MKSAFETEIEGVFVLPQVVDYKNAPESVEALENQGAEIAAALLGQPAVNAPAGMYHKNIAADDLAIDLIGQVDLPPEFSQIVDWFSLEQKKYRKFVIQDQIIKGVVLINAQNDVEKVKKLVLDAAPGVDLAAQFEMTATVGAEQHINESITSS